MGENADLKAHVRKAQEDLNPLRVLELFKRVSAEVRVTFKPGKSDGAMRRDNGSGRGEESYISDEITKLIINHLFRI